MNKPFLIDPNVRALIFDCDGTLVDSMPLHMKAWEEAFQIINEKFDYNFLFAAKGMKETEIIEAYNKHFKTKINPIEIVTIKHQYLNNNIEFVKPIIQVVEVAKNYFGKIPLGVVSGSVKEIVHKELEVVEIFHLFNNILTADDPFKPKPAPDIFYASAENLNVEPKNCLVFEDGDPGLEAAQNAGMKTIDVRKYLDN